MRLFGDVSFGHVAIPAVDAAATPEFVVRYDLQLYFMLKLFSYWEKPPKLNANFHCVIGIEAQLAWTTGRVRIFGHCFHNFLSNDCTNKFYKKKSKSFLENI